MVKRGSSSPRVDAPVTKCVKSLGMLDQAYVFFVVPSACHRLCFGVRSTGQTKGSHAPRRSRSRAENAELIDCEERNFTLG